MTNTPARQRKVRIFFTQEGKSEYHNSGVETWGELKSELERKGMSFENKAIRVRETRVRLDADAALLPSVQEFPEELTLFIYPERSKAGAKKTKKKVVKKPVKRAKVAKKTAAKKAAKKSKPAKSAKPSTKGTGADANIVSDSQLAAEARELGNTVRR